MKKLVVAAALAVSCFAVPSLPASAAPALSDAEANCLIFPLLKKECWEMGAERARGTTTTVATTVESAADEMKLPLWWKCEAAPKGSGHLLDC